MEPIGKEIEIGVACDTSALDEALEKTEALGELVQDMAPQVSIRGCRGCTFNIYPSRTVFMGGEGDDE